MVQARHIAVLLVAGLLSGCGYGALDPYTSALSPAKQSAFLNGSDQPPATITPASHEAADNSPPATSSLFARAATQSPPPAATAPPPAVAAQPKPAAKPVTVASADPQAMPSAPPAAVNPEPHGRAYLFRGVAGLIYSRGMDGLAERIRRVGIPASVDTYLMWRGVVDQAIRDYRRDPQPVIIIGHSMGGDAAVDFAETLNAQNIPVSLMVTYDPTRIADDVPPNVERYINIYQSSNFMGGGNVVQGSQFHGHYASFNLKEHSELVHINIEKADSLHQQIVSKIVELSTTPAAAEGEAIPLHLEVPARASIELWDSGYPVAAHDGDTLRSLAATYHVPVWSLVQINSISERTTLSEGQRIIVPRHLAPMSTPSQISAYAGR